MKEPRLIVPELAEAWNAHDRERFLGYFADEIVFEDVAMGERLVGKDAFGVGFFDFWTHAFPDTKLTDPTFVVDGRWIVLRARFTGTHTGFLRLPDREIEPTGKRVDTPYALFWELGEDGRIERGWILYDRLTSFEQLGLVQAPALALA